MLMYWLMFGLAMAGGPVLEATAYVKTCPGCSGYTAWKSLHADAYGPIKMMAVDPKVFKLGLCYKLKFTDERNDDHESVYLAADTGGDIKGNRIDLLLKTEESARRFGRQEVTLISSVPCPVDVAKLPRAAR